MLRSELSDSHLDDKPGCPAVKIEHGQPAVRPVEGQLGVDEESRARSSRQDGPLKPLGHLKIARIDSETVRVLRSPEWL